MIKELRDKNELFIVKYANNKRKLNKYLLIANILKEDQCFFKININDAFNILKDLEISNYEEYYISLINYNVY